MSKKPKIVVVIQTFLDIQYRSFIGAWKNLFERHEVTLVTVFDGEVPHISIFNYASGKPVEVEYSQTLYSTHKNLIYRYTDACRNLGFIVAAHLQPDYVLTLDDDVEPLKPDYTTGLFDPIQDHLDVLQKRVPLGWMNTAHDTELYFRGVPYSIRDEAPVMLSHGVWVGTPDFDGETQLKLETNNGVPYSLPYYVGPIPRGVLFPVCGMNLMVKRDALPYLYFAPMGVDTNVEGLNRFSDIWMGVVLKKQFDALGWACYTGGSTILHTRASDAKKNYEQEKLGREWNEYINQSVDDYSFWTPNSKPHEYFKTYQEKREQFTHLIRGYFKQHTVFFSINNTREGDDATHRM